MLRFPVTPTSQSSAASRSVCSGTLSHPSAPASSPSLDEVAVRIYSPEKSIADCFKYRNKVGLDVAVQALRTYRKQAQKADLTLIAKFARVGRVEKVMRPYPGGCAVGDRDIVTGST